MKIAILGGTGHEGAGLALRWLKAGHAIFIGSRDAGRAQAKAQELHERVAGKVSGMTNVEAARAGEMVVLAVPYAGLAKTLVEVKEACRGKVVVSAVVPLIFGGARLFTPPSIGSAAEEAQQLLGAGARVVAAFHHIAAHELVPLDHPIDCDLLLCGDDPAAKQPVVELGASMGLRAFDAGPLENAGPLEGITAILATLNRRYKVKGAGIRITGLPDWKLKADR
jgi:NADPH-dependent F420 reductase